MQIIGYLYIRKLLFIIFDSFHCSYVLWLVKVGAFLFQNRLFKKTLFTIFVFVNETFRYEGVPYP